MPVVKKSETVVEERSPSSRLAGSRELAEHFGVSGGAIMNWVTRYSDFPEPVAVLYMGRIWNLDDVIAWYEGAE